MCEKECPTGAIVNYRKKKKPVKKAAEAKPGSRGSACTGISLVIAFIKNRE